MEALKQKYGDQVHFLLVYIRDAHAGEIRFKDISQPANYKERQVLAKRTRKNLSITTLMVIDEMNNSVMRDYGSLPNSAYIIGQNGRVFHKQPWMDSKLIEPPLKALIEMGGSSDKAAVGFKTGANKQLTNRRASEFKSLDSYKDAPVEIGTGKKIAWITDMDQAKKLAKDSGVPIFVEFYFDNCGFCVAMAKGPLLDASVIGLSRKYVPVKLNLESAAGTKLAEELEVNGSPAFVVFSPDGKVLIKHSGFAEADYMTNLLREGLVMAQMK